MLLIVMAWINLCVLFISLISVQGYGVIHATPSQRTVRSANQKTNGSYKIMNRYGKPFVNKRVSVPEEGSVVFPGLTSRSGPDNYLQIPDECKRIGICENVPNYPSETVAKVIREFERRNKTYNIDVMEPPKIAERIGPFQDDIELCRSSDKLFVPELVRDELKWYYVVNDQQRPIQKFRVEVCTDEPSSACSSIATFQDGYTARCVQKYMLRQMLVLDNKNDTVEKQFKVPSCCSCVAKTVS